MPPQANINGKAPPERKTSFRQDDDVRANILQAGEYHLDDNGHNFRKKIGFGAKVHFANAVSNMINFQRGEAETIRRVLDEIDHVAVKRMSEGFNEFNFSVGVINCFFIIYMFGAHPEHMWLVYLVEGLYMIPRKFYNMWHAKPLNQALYYLDFCWAMNFTAIVVLFFLILAGSSGSFISGYARESFYNALLGVSCGALMGANIVLPFVACLFHDVNTMTGFFIHVMPPLVMYTFMWHSADIKEAWPSIFQLTYMEQIHYFPKSGPIFAPGSALDSVVGNSVALYVLWWIPYVCFMLLVGIDLPKKFKPDGTNANPK